jgi:peptide/nickel transport system substrate-binding protein
MKLRSHVPLAALGLSLALIVAACGTADDDSDARPLEDDSDVAPSRTTLEVVSPIEPPDLLPYSAHGGKTHVYDAMLTPIVRTDAENEPYSDVLESWEVSDDALTVTFSLRPNIEWSDGTPFTAEDVAFTYNIVRDHQGEVVHGAEIGYLDEAIADDERTIRFVLNESNPRWWATTLTSNHGVTEQIFPKHIWEDQDFMNFTFYDEDEGWPIGTGPYTLTRTASDQKVFDLRDTWWAAETGFKEMPQVERVIYIPNRDESLSAQMLITNAVDMSIRLSVPTLEAVFVQNEEVTTFSGQEPPFGFLDWCPIDLGFNNQVEPWSNRDVRWAINYAIDRDRLVNLAEGGAGEVALHQFTPYEWFEPFEEAASAAFLDRERFGELRGRDVPVLFGVGHLA